MKGIVLAGGLGTRLKPLTDITNKHLLPVYDKPMIFYPIQTLAKAGIYDVMVIVGEQFAGHFISVLKNGKELGLKHLEYAYQEGSGGIADALSLAEDFADGDNITVILGDNCTDFNIEYDVLKFEGDIMDEHGCHLFLKAVPDPERFGVADLDDNGNIKKIIEKPTSPVSNYAVTGLYIYDNKVFDYIRELTPSSRGEKEITDVNMAYIKNNDCRWSYLAGYWKDLGQPDSLLDAANYWRNKNGRS